MRIGLSLSDLTINQGTALLLLAAAAVTARRVVAGEATQVCNQALVDNLRLKFEAYHVPR